MGLAPVVSRLISGSNRKGGWHLFPLRLGLYKPAISPCVPPCRLAPSRPQALRSSKAPTAFGVVQLKISIGYNLPVSMRRLIRTRRLSISAVVSLLAFGLVATTDARSFWHYDTWISQNGCLAIGLANGSAVTNYEFATKSRIYPRGRHMQFKTTNQVGSRIWQNVRAFPIQCEMIHDRAGNGGTFCFCASLWPLLLLLLIIPMRWLFARPESSPAFPVVTRIAGVAP